MLRFINCHKKETLSKNKPKCGIVSAIQGYTSIYSIWPNKLKPQLEANSISRMAQVFAPNGMAGWWLSVAKAQGDTFWTTHWKDHPNRSKQIQAVDICLKLPIGHVYPITIYHPVSDLKIVERCHCSESSFGPCGKHLAACPRHTVWRSWRFCPVASLLKSSDIQHGVQRGRHDDLGNPMSKITSLRIYWLY